jgi:uncharacterized protein YndB with AHSA1/START domain
MTALIIIVVLLGLFLAFVATRPNVFIVTRSGHINVAPENVFPLINDFHNWTRWSPWEKKDPNLKRTYSGAPAGVGAHYAWAGDKNVGEGSMTITESVPASRIRLDLNFLKPFKADNLTVFTFTPEGGGTRVDWRMEGPVPFLFKIMHLFFNMDKMVGNDFEKGLAEMKRVAEASGSA